MVYIQFDIFLLLELQNCFEFQAYSLDSDKSSNSSLGSGWIELVQQCLLFRVYITHAHLFCNPLSKFLWRRSLPGTWIVFATNQKWSFINSFVNILTIQPYLFRSIANFDTWRSRITCFHADHRQKNRGWQKTREKTKKPSGKIN